MIAWPAVDPEAAVLAALARLGIGYERLECDPEAADTAIAPTRREANSAGRAARTSRFSALR